MSWRHYDIWGRRSNIALPLVQGEVAFYPRKGLTWLHLIGPGLVIVALLIVVVGVMRA